MANELAVPAQLGSEQIELIKRTICPGASKDELDLFLAVCNRTGLDPFSKQIYAIRRTTKGVSKMVIQTGIDGYRALADRQGNYGGSDEPLFNDGKTEYQIRADESKPPLLTATVTVYKIVGGVRCPFTATASWDSYCPPDGQDSMWQKFPFLMLSKCAEALALRKGWATQLSGLYTDAEMQQAGGATEYVEVQHEQRHVALDRPSEPTGEVYAPAPVLVRCQVKSVVERTSRAGNPYRDVTMTTELGGSDHYLYFGKTISAGFTGPLDCELGMTDKGKPVIQHAHLPKVDAPPADDGDMQPPQDYLPLSESLSKGD